MSNNHETRETSHGTLKTCIQHQGSKIGKLINKFTNSPINFQNRARNKNKIMQNKPNLQNDEINITPLLTNSSENFMLCRSRKNKAKQTQNKPNLKNDEMNVTACNTRGYDNLRLLFHLKNKAKQTQNEPNFEPKLALFWLTRYNDFPWNPLNPRLNNRQSFRPKIRANTKLVMDADGELYQLNYEDGLIRLSDGNSIVPSGTLPAVSEPRYSSSATVFVGLQGEVDDWWGRPITDAAFDADGYLYVVPVVVDPAGEEPYTAAAKLELESGETPPYTYSLVRLYDDPDADLPGDNRELNALREIDVDNAGNLYVVNAHTLNDSDILWKYDIDTGVMQDRLYLSAPGGDINIPAPIAMCLSEYDSRLYLASSKNEPDADSDLIYGLSTDTLGLERTITVNGMGHITSIAEDSATGTLWIAGFTMEDIPEYLYSNEPPFYEPYLAEVPSDNNDVQALSLVGAADLALPLSIEWTGITNNCEGADLDGSNGVDFVDFAILANQWLQPPGSPSADIAPEVHDGFVDMMDLEILIKYWLATGCLDIELSFQKRLDSMSDNQWYTKNDY